MQKKPLVSILIASYNKEKYVKRCINSCLSQTYDNTEIIFYDDLNNRNDINVEKFTKKIKKISRVNFSNYIINYI